MRIMVLVLGLAACAALLVGCGKAVDNEDGDTTKTGETMKPDTPVEPEAPKDHPGKAILEESCTACHELDKVTRIAMTEDNWADQVEKCTESDPLDDEKAAVLVEYLAENYGE
jgi:cytochrome c5